MGMFITKIEFEKLTDKGIANCLVLGTPGSGKAYHPWDNLKECKCGGYPWMIGTDGKDFHSGGPYKIVCLKCHKCTNSSDNISTIKVEWNEHLN